LLETNQEFLPEIDFEENTPKTVESDDNDLFARENVLLDANQQFLPETVIQESTSKTSEPVLQIADDEDLLKRPESEDAFSEGTSEFEIIENESAALEYIRAQAEQIEDADTGNFASVLDEFADLEGLLVLEEEVISTPDISISDMDFAELEELLDEEKASTVTAIPVNNVTSKTVSSELTDEFGDLEKLLKEADQTISHSPTVILSTVKISVLRVVLRDLKKQCGCR
jgi:chemosensory pili system protein ChpA (sensor histidine kinase/response regulator)